MNLPSPRRPALLLLVAAALAAACSERLPSEAGLAAPAGPRLTVTPAEAFASIDAGSTHACGLTSAGQAWCWGRNNYGQLGDSSAATTLVPVPTYQPMEITFICEIVDGEWTCSPQPSPAAFTQLSAGGSHNCALSPTGQAFCWGYNADGRLGDSTVTNPLVPVAVLPVGGIVFTQVSAGGGHTCGLDSSGQAHCWGTNNNAQLGDSTLTFRAGPTAVRHPTGVTFTQVSSGEEHTCALDGAAGQAYCWGYGGDGALGNNSILVTRMPSAVQQPAGVTFVSVVTEYDHSCGLTSGGQAYCWGRNTNGQLGDSTLTTRTAPVAVKQPAGVTFASLTTGATHTCGLTSGGQSYCWGSNQYGQIGNAGFTSSRIPVAVSHPTGVSFGALHAGGYGTFGLDGVGQTWGWGRNNFGQIGDNSTTNRSAPVAVWH